jgi:hypothetical protein
VDKSILRFGGGIVMRIVNGWIVEEVNECTCAGGFAAVGYAHERGCGLEPVEPITPLRATVRTYPNSWEGYPHSWQWIIPNPVAGEQECFAFGWEPTFEQAIKAAHDQLKLLGELFAAYSELAVTS